MIMMMMLITTTTTTAATTITTTINLIYIAQFDNKGIPTALYIVIKYI